MLPPRDSQRQGAGMIVKGDLQACILGRGTCQEEESWTKHRSAEAGIKPSTQSRVPSLHDRQERKDTPIFWPIPGATNPASDHENSHPSISTPDSALHPTCLPQGRAADLLHMGLSSTQEHKPLDFPSLRSQPPPAPERVGPMFCTFLGNSLCPEVMRLHLPG